jgi:hypothetical protein
VTWVGSLRKDHPLPLRVSSLRFGCPALWNLQASMFGYRVSAMMAADRFGLRFAAILYKRSMQLSGKRSEKRRRSARRDWGANMPTATLTIEKWNIRERCWTVLRECAVEVRLTPKRAVIVSGVYRGQVYDRTTGREIRRCDPLSWYRHSIKEITSEAPPLSRKGER